jgi:hypothetical protein
MRSSRCLALLLLALTGAWGQNPLNDRTYWLGNTFGGGLPPNHHWMMQGVGDLAVHGGRIYCLILWDERGGEANIYTTDGQHFKAPTGWHSWGWRGGGAVAVDDHYVYDSVGHDQGDGGGRNFSGVARYDLDGNPAKFPGAINDWRLAVNDDHTHPPTGLAVYGGELFVADPLNKRIAVYTTADLKPARDLPAPDAGRLVVDQTAQHALWLIDTAAKVVKRLGRDGADLGAVVRDCQQPVALAIDRPTGDLLVLDDGLDRRQVRRYRADSGQHVPGGDFGQPVYAGPRPGVVGPDRFYDLTSLDTDDEGNLYLGSGRGLGGQLRKFDRQRQPLWTLSGLEFVTCAAADPGHNSDVFDSLRRFKMDYAAAPGAGWAEAAVTLDPRRYPLDPRAHDGNLAMRVARVGGQRLLIGRYQMGSPFWFWRFDGEIAVPAAAWFPAGTNDAYPPGHPKGAFLWSDADGDGAMQPGEYQAAPAGWFTGNAATVDDRLDLWLTTVDWRPGKGRITRIPFKGLNAVGAPTWDPAAAESQPIPADSGIRQVSKIWHDAAHDRMYLGVYTAEQPKVANGWEQQDTGKVLQRFDDWSKAPHLAWSTVIEPPVIFNKGVPRAWAFAGDYAFVAYVRLTDQSVVDVVRLSDGSHVGTLVPTREVGPVGWLDMNEGVTAVARADGSYLVFLEEDWMAKNLFWQWRPAS